MGRTGNSEELKGIREGGEREAREKDGGNEAARRIFDNKGRSRTQNGDTRPAARQGKWNRESMREVCLQGKLQEWKSSGGAGKVAKRRR